MLATAGLIALGCVSASAQQVTGVPGSPGATTTIDGKQSPPSEPESQSCANRLEQSCFLPYCSFRPVSAGATNNSNAGCGRNAAGDAGGTDSLAAGNSTCVLLWPAVVLHVILTALLARNAVRMQRDLR